ncbi:MAG: hypothetical protein M0R06_03265 [Sphaerochaeta sp.]|jgi:hypothetical protein|nr:hypothetical protein [Sphaerochaeta sp.]
MPVITTADTHFTRHRAGTWVQPVMRGYRMQCCQCGAVHRLNFRIGVDKDGRERVQFQAFRAKTKAK